MSEEGKKTAPVRNSRKVAVAETRLRISKTAVVTIKLLSDSTTTLTQTMRKITSKVNLKDLDIHVLDAHESRSGWVTLVVKKEEEAMILAEKLRTTSEDVQAALQDAGMVAGSSPPDITVRSSGCVRNGYKTTN